MPKTVKLLPNTIRSIVEKSFQNGINSVQPHNILYNSIKTDSDGIIIQNQKFIVTNAYMVGFGKAVGCMVQPLVTVLQKVPSICVKKGIISVPFGFKESMRTKDYQTPTCANIEILDGARDNFPDEHSFNTAHKILNLAKSLTAEDTLFVLISGGGSALLPMPIPGLSLGEKVDITRLLSNSGATIHEMNTVRKSLSAIKGGKLAECTKATVICLIISDVMGDSLQVIASGPTVLNTDAGMDSIQILNKYGITLTENILSKIKNPLHQNIAGFDHVFNYLIANNCTALEAVRKYLSGQNEIPTKPISLTCDLKGEASEVGEFIADLGLNILDHLTSGKSSLNLTNTCKELGIHCTKIDELLVTLTSLVNSSNKSVCLIFGGETTVVVKEKGKGGRNQELILSASIRLRELAETKQPVGNIFMLSGGTDGIDGPTDAAGAETYYSKNVNSPVRLQTTEAADQSLDPKEFLANNNSYEYFRQLSNGGYHLKTGHTGTNVMDLMILFISAENFKLEN